MIRQLCGHLDPRRFYVTVARAIERESETNHEFAQQLVQTFSWILLTAQETKVLRDELAREDCDGDQAKPLFLELLTPWFHNPVSALVLCLWAQQFELASQLTARFAAFEP